MASNEALRSADGEFVTFLDHDDELHVHALAAIIAKLNENPSLDLIYTDEDKIDEMGNRYDPFFKPNWNPDLLFSQNYICHLAVYRRSLLTKISGLRKGFEGAQDYDLALRVTELTSKIGHVEHVLYHWRSIPGSTALSGDQKSYTTTAACKAIEDAIFRRGIDAYVTENNIIGMYHRVVYRLDRPGPLVSIIIPIRDKVHLLETCLDGLLNNTKYTNFEILIVDNDSEEQQTHRYLKKVKSTRIKILHFPGQFNYAAINNFAVSKASGEIILLLNNDSEVIYGDWLEELVSHAIRPGVGAVGGRLYFPDDTIQHDGIIVGIGGVAGYAHPGLPRSESGQFGRGAVTQNCSAVTAAALAIRKSVYLKIGGLDEKNLAVAFNDVDFCLRVMEAGYRNVYTPFAELYHHESVSRGPDTDPRKARRFEREALYMKDRWGAAIDDDVCYNPNLSLRQGFRLDLARGKSWPWQAS